MASDRRALAEFDAAYPALVTVAARAARNFFRFDTAQVEDVVAETMARTYERWERVRRHANPDGWVVVCTKNVCLEQLRSRARRGDHGDVEDRYATADPTDRLDTADAVATSLAQLTKRQRDVVVLRYLMDCDEATTAAALGMSVSQVKTAAHEARHRLRHLLADDDGADGISA